MATSSSSSVSRAAVAAGSDAGAHLIRPEGRDPAVVAFEIEVVSFFFQAADLLGVPKSVAAIYGVCFASPEPLSLADIDQRLDISIGSISQGLRVLREVGALRVAEVGGQKAEGGRRTAEGGASRFDDRRDYYEPDMELRKLASRFIEERLEKQLKAGKGRLQSIRAAIPPDRNGSAKELKARLRYLESWHDQGKALVPLVRAFLKLT